MSAGLNASNYILNIVELQNTITSASGLSPLGSLASQVAQIQEMVQYDQKRINANVISNFNVSPIQVVAPMNFSNVAVTASGTTGSGSIVGGASTTTIGTGSAGTLSVGVGTTSLLLTQSGVSSFYVTSAGDVTFSGTVTAQNFVTASDMRWKQNVAQITDYDTILSNVKGVRFEWSDSGRADVGFIAQHLLPVLPEAVVEGPDGLQVSYMKMIPVLVEAVKGLAERVRVLEGGVPRHVFPSD